MNKEQKELINKLVEYVPSYSMKQQIKDTFPKLFKPAIEVGKVYRSPNHKNWMLYVTKIECGKVHGYGLGVARGWMNPNTCWMKPSTWEIDELSTAVEATKEEWLEALIKEAIKRYKIGDKFKCLENGQICEITQLEDFKNTGNNIDKLWCNSVITEEFDNALFFKDGVWAEVIEQPEEEPSLLELKRELSRLAATAKNIEIQIEIMSKNM